MRYLLDTNACIQAMRGASAVVSALARLTPAEVAVSSVTCYGLYVGVAKFADPTRELAKVETFLGAVCRVALDDPAAQAAAQIRAGLESRGEMIGPYDVLLAGHANALGLVLVTANTKEFARIPELALENWEFG